MRIWNIKCCRWLIRDKLQEIAQSSEPHTQYLPSKGLDSPWATREQQSQVHHPPYSSLWPTPPPQCCVVGVQLLQVGGTAVCFECLCTSGIPATQLTLQDENGIYALINSPYFFVRGKREGSHSPRCQLHVSVQNMPRWLMFSKFSLAVEIGAIRKILGWCEDFPNTCLHLYAHMPSVYNAHCPLSPVWCIFISKCMYIL